MAEGGPNWIFIIVLFSLLTGGGLYIIMLIAMNEFWDIGGQNIDNGGINPITLDFLRFSFTSVLPFVILIGLCIWWWTSTNANKGGGG